MRFPNAVSPILLAALAACASDSGYSSGPGGSPNPPPSGSTTSVAIQDYSFAPAGVTIEVGGIVRWTNNGPSTHTATSDGGVWDSGQLGGPGGGYGGGSAGSYQYAFSSAGSYPYHCMNHPQMTGTITVTP